MGICESIAPLVEFTAGTLLVDQLTHISDLTEHMPERPAFCPPHILKVSLSKNVVGELQTWIAAFEDCSRYSAALRGVAHEIDLLLNATDDIDKSCANDIARQFSECSLSDIEARLKTNREQLKRMSILRDMIGDDLMPGTLEDLNQLARFVGLLGGLTHDLLERRGKELNRPSAVSVLSEARAKSAILNSSRARLAQRFDIGHLPAAIDLRSAFDVVFSAGLWQRWFGKEYKAARLLYGRLSLDLKPAPARTMARDFRELAAWMEDSAALATNDAVRACAGQLFKGADTPWEDLEATASWLNRVNQTVPEHCQYRGLALSAEAPQLLSLAQRGSEIAEVVSLLLPHEPSQMTIDNWHSRLQTEICALEQLLRSAQAATVRPETTVGQLPCAVINARQYLIHKSAFDRMSAVLTNVGLDASSLEVREVQSIVGFVSGALRSILWDNHAARLANDWDGQRAHVLSTAEVARSTAFQFRARFGGVGVDRSQLVVANT